MKKNEKQFLKYASQHVSSKHTFNDLKNSPEYNDLPLIKPKVNKKVIGITSIAGGLSLALVISLVLMFTLNVKRPPKLNLENYEVNLKDAAEVGIIPFKENENKQTFVKKISGSDEIVPVNFLNKKETPSNKANSSGLGITIKANRNNDESSFIKQQSELGWIPNNYLVYEHYTFLQFIPAPEYFEKHYIVDDKYEMNEGKIGMVPSRPIDNNIGHYYDGLALPLDFDYFSTDIRKSFIVDNDTGYIYSLEGIHSLHYFNNALCIVVDDDTHNADTVTRVVELGIEGGNLKITQVNDIEYRLYDDVVSFRNEIWKDKYGQYYSRLKEVNPYSKIVKNIENPIFTADHQMLFIKDHKLYEYGDNFSISEVDDSKVYQLSGLYKDYTYITNKYILDLPHDTFYNIELDDHIYSYDMHRMRLSAFMKGKYIFLDNNKTLRILNDDLIAIIESFKAEYPDEWFNVVFNYEHNTGDRFIDWVLEHSSIISNDIVPEGVNIPDDVYYCYFYGGGDPWYQYPVASLIALDRPINVTRWVEGGKQDYVLEIDDNGEVVFTLVSEYVPEENDEIILSPINA